MTASTAHASTRATCPAAGKNISLPEEPTPRTRHEQPPIHPCRRPASGHPFLGLSRTDAGEALQAQLRDATFTALQRLFDQCERLRPDFLVLAGDIYNQEEHSVKAQLALRDGCVRLQACGIPVFWAHGNHDPLDSRLKTVDWPDNVTIFGPEPEQHVLYRDGAPLAVIHGISHARIREACNLALLFHRQPETDCFQLGVLHCSVEGSPTQDRYAPCSLDDLRAAGLDAGSGPCARTPHPGAPSLHRLSRQYPGTPHQ